MTPCPAAAPNGARHVPLSAWHCMARARHHAYVHTNTDQAVLYACILLCAARAALCRALHGTCRAPIVPRRALQSRSPRPPAPSISLGKTTASTAGLTLDESMKWTGVRRIDLELGNIRKIQSFCTHAPARTPLRLFSKSISSGGGAPPVPFSDFVPRARNLWFVFMSVCRSIDFFLSLTRIGPRCSGGAR